MKCKLYYTEYAEPRRPQCDPTGTSHYVKMTCILMFSNDRRPRTISEDSGISPATIYRHTGQYQEGGSEEPSRDSYKGYCGGLDSVRAAVFRKGLKGHIYTDARQRDSISGLLNACDVTDVIAYDCKSVNAQSARELYEQENLESER